MSDFNENDVDFWIENGYNVLLTGKHGTGKTARVLEAFEKHGLKYQYYSTSTMDPWVDFIGVPKEMKNAAGESYLGLVRPKQFAEDEVEAIFLDEFNRSSKKVRNAVMELIQFKSINGKKFKNLKVVWAAINPDDEEKTYDVEPLDPAQKDRFHMMVDVPYMPSLDYFTKRYGNNDAKTAIEWWQQLETTQKDLVSPRRLDYAMDVFRRGGNLRNVLGRGIDVTQLIDSLNNGSIQERLTSLMNNGEKETSRIFLRNENNYNSAIPIIQKNTELSKFFVPLLTEEKVIALMNKSEDIKNMVFAEYGIFKDVILALADAGTSDLSATALKTVLVNEPEKQTAGSPVGTIYVTSTVLPIDHDPEKSVDTFLGEYSKLFSFGQTRTNQEIYDFLSTNIPFDFVSDETQQKGSKVAHIIVDLVNQLTEKSTDQELSTMVKLGKLMNHTLLYMSVFQSEDTESQVKHNPSDFIISDPARLSASIKKLQSQEIGFNVKN